MSNEKKVPKGFHWRYVIEKPDPFKPAKAVNQFCHQMRIEGGELVRCMAETKGRTYCKACLEADARRPSGSRFVGVKSVGKWGHMS